MIKGAKVNFHWADTEEHKRVLELLKSAYLEVINQKLGSTKWDEVTIHLFKLNNDVVVEINGSKGDYFGNDFEGLTKTFKMYDVFNEEEEGDN